ncbi:AraC family transcriptional regulator [Sporomusa sp.]|uniref:AraC family transcriptional regulator n=1 Tax=Sporomusa sp. TaxID=2078658 RepID=UPI002CB90624|nr:AraC family transcriptional regulator [Sporomusa sp.]HWR45852.1 AraC family transcriptional regulator [Sporomusa sp.]
MGDFFSLRSQIPPDIWEQTSNHIGSGIALFKPRVYINNVKMLNPDYHLVLPSTTPPPVLIGKKEYVVSKNRLITFNPGDEVYIRHAVKTKEYTTIAIDKQFLAKIAGELGFEKASGIVFAEVDNPCSTNIRQTIMQLQREISIFGGGLPLMLDSIAIQLVVYLLRETASNFDSKLAAKDNYSYVHKAIDYMQAYYDIPISLDDMCRLLHITPYHFIRLFKEKTGLTPHAFLLKIRMENAKKMLERRECTVAEAAYACGFSTIPHFSAAFKQQTGTAPSEYKKIYSR